MRLFIGVSPDAPARDALFQTARRLMDHADGRYVDSSLYHITLAFIGEADRKTAAGAVRAMEAAARAVPPFSVSLGEIGCFGSIVWRGIAPEALLVGLSDVLRLALSDHGVPYDAKPFRAHFTLARDSRLPLAARGMEFPAASFPVAALTLFESRRDQAGLRYVPLAEVPLRLA